MLRLNHDSNSFQSYFTVGSDNLEAFSTLVHDGVRSGETRVPIQLTG